MKTTLIEEAPCSAATNAEIESVGGKLESATAEDVQDGKGCAWIFADFAGDVSASMNRSEPDGLSHLYALKKQGSGVTTFEPLPDIDGYPAVVFANGGEGEGACNLALGVRNDMMYYIVTQLRDGNPYLKDPCCLNVKIAELTLQHLKHAQ